MLLCRGAVHKNLNSALPNLRIFVSCSCLHFKLRPGYRYQQYENYWLETSQLSLWRIWLTLCRQTTSLSLKPIRGASPGSTCFILSVTLWHFYNRVVISVVTCLKKDFPNMTFAPSTPYTHDFNTTIMYTCDVGYQYSSGDLVRTCNAKGNWSGAEPVCDGRLWSSCFIIIIPALI